MVNTDRIADMWTDASDDYDRIVSRELRNLRDVDYWRHELDTRLGDEPRDVLDVGCGNGYYMWRMLGAGADSVVGMFINTLPVRIDIGSTGVREQLRQTHAQLAQLIRHERAALALAQDPDWLQHAAAHSGLLVAD